MKKISLIIITISGLLLSFMPMAISDVNIPPKGVSQSLWDVYRELTISELDGAERNFRSANALSVFIKGSPTERDVNVIDSILSAFAQNCQNITPYSEVFQAVISYSLFSHPALESKQTEGKSKIQSYEKSTHQRARQGSRAEIKALE